MNGIGGRYVREPDGTLYQIDEETNERILIESPNVGESQPLETTDPDESED